MLDPQHQQLYSQYIDPSTGQFRAEVTKDHNQLNRLWFSLQDTDFDGELDGYELLMSMGDGVHSEQAIPLKYLRTLNGLYEEWFERYDQSPKLLWDSERLDYLTDLADRIEFQRSIERFL